MDSCKYKRLNVSSSWTCMANLHRIHKIVDNLLYKSKDFTRVVRDADLHLPLRGQSINYQLQAWVCNQRFALSFQSSGDSGQSARRFPSHPLARHTRRCPPVDYFFSASSWNLERIELYLMRGAVAHRNDHAFRPRRRTYYK